MAAASVLARSTTRPIRASAEATSDAAPRMSKAGVTIAAMSATEPDGGVAFPMSTLHVSAGLSHPPGPFRRKSCSFHLFYTAITPFQTLPHCISSAQAISPRLAQDQAALYASLSRFNSLRSESCSLLGRRSRTSRRRPEHDEDDHLPPGGAGRSVVRDADRQIELRSRQDVQRE